MLGTCRSVDIYRIVFGSMTTMGSLLYCTQIIEKGTENIKRDYRITVQRIRRNGHRK